MENFIDLLEEQGSMEMPFIGNQTMNTRMFNRLKLGDYSLSIQGSYYHYCTPRLTLPPNKYKAMEVALYHQGSWITPYNHESLVNFPRIKELEEVWEPFDCGVGGNVPVDLIQSLCDFLEGLEGESHD